MIVGRTASQICTVPQSRGRIGGHSAVSKLASAFRLLVVTMLLIYGVDRSAANDDSPRFDDDQIRAAFVASHDGFSSDELMIRDRLRERFVQALRESEDATAEWSAADQRAALLHLLKLRKTSKLNVKTTKRARSAEPGYRWIAEIASRAVTDRHRITTDVMLADPDLRTELDREAEAIRSDVDPYQLRRAILALRKTRLLRPELVLKVADWGQTVHSMTLADARRRVEANDLPKNPGVYLFRDSTGYLYIGEAQDLAVRIGDHLGGSDREALADYLSRSEDGGQATKASGAITLELHVFAKDSPAKSVTVRRAYESELIRSRKPRFNIRP